MHGFLVNLGKINNKAIWRNCWFLNRSFIIYMFRHLYLYMLTRLRNAPKKLYFVFRKKHLTKKQLFNKNHDKEILKTPQKGNLGKIIQIRLQSLERSLLDGFQQPRPVLTKIWMLNPHLLSLSCTTTGGPQWGRDTIKLPF